VTLLSSLKGKGVRRLRVASALSLFFLSNGDAAEWVLSGTFNPSLEYDDNIFMREDRTGDYHTSATPTLRASRRLEDTEIVLSAGYVLDRYEDTKSLNTDNPFVRFSSSYQTERSTLGLDASYEESTSRNDAADDTGDFETNAIVTNTTIAPSYSYQLSERDTLSLNASYSKREFSTTDFSDSTTRSVSSAWQHQFTERFNGGLSVSASNTKSKGLLSSTDDDTYNVSLTSNYELSEAWSMGGSVGVRQLESEQTNSLGTTTKNRSNGESLDLNLSYFGDIDSFNVGVSRSISPSSTGEVNEVDRVSLTLTRRLSGSLTTSISGSYQVTSSASDAGSDERKNINVSPSMNWQYSPDVSVSLSYNYRQQQESLLDTDVDSNSVMLTLNYAWDGFRASR